jgi:hypothetical protein
MSFYVQEQPNVRHLIWAALEKGYRNSDDIFSFVRKRHRRVSRVAVEEQYEEVWNSDQAADAFIWCR